MEENMETRAGSQVPTHEEASTDAGPITHLTGYAVSADRSSLLRVLDERHAPAARASGDDLSLLKLLTQLAATVSHGSEMVEQLCACILELRARNAELATYNHTVAHELKGTLGLIVGFSELLEERGADMPEEELCRCLRLIAQRGRRLMGIVDRTLLLSGACDVDVEVGPLDMARIVADVLDHLAYELDEYQAEIVLPDAWPVARGYGPWVEEVWVNYVSNACKYGGRPPLVELGASRPRLPPCREGGGDDCTFPPPGGTEGGMVRFWVRDNGPGLRPEEQARLFAPFTRLAPVRAHGHGVGLSIVRHIVDKLGGEVGVESEGVPGRGSVFSFTLPGAEGDI
jgi:signal transduction histidine kinase